MRIGQRRAVRLDDGLASERIALDPCSRGVVVDREGAELRNRLLLAMAQMRFLADEVLALDLPPRHVGLDDGVVRVELEAEGAVGLLETSSRAVHTDAGGHEAVGLTRLPHRVPESESPLHRYIELP